MFTLITALAEAHAALLSTSDTDAKLASTARKIEATMVDQLKSCSDEERTKLVGAIMNSGSLKSLKLVPEEARANPYRGSAFHYPITEFIVKQPPSYIREAVKRGFTLEDGERLKIFKEILNNPDSENRKQKESLVLSVSPKRCNHSPSRFAEMIIKVIIEQKERSDAVVPLAARILKQSLKSDKEGMISSFANFLGIYDPSAASDVLYRVIATYAMLGVPRPPKTIFEHDEMERLAKSITTSSGRRALLDEVGGLEAWLAGGHQNPPKIIAEFEKKRQHWCPPHSASTRMIAYRRTF